MHLWLLALVALFSTQAISGVLVPLGSLEKGAAQKDGDVDRAEAVAKIRATLEAAVVNELKLPIGRRERMLVDSFDCEVHGCRVVCNPRGYMNWHGEFENKDFDPGLVVSF